MNETTEIEKLVALLSTETAARQITFREESARDMRYALIVGVGNAELLHKLARIFGCPNGHFLWMGETHFEAADDWHGQGDVNLRDLADEFIAIKGEFFDFDITIAELRSQAANAGLNRLQGT